LDDDLGVLVSQILELLKSGDGLLEGRNLMLRNIPGDVLSVFPSLVVVVGALRSLPQNAKFAALHVLDLGDLLQE
jgi:hypothetical protein